MAWPLSYLQHDHHRDWSALNSPLCCEASDSWASVLAGCYLSLTNCAPPCVASVGLLVVVDSHIVQLRLAAEFSVALCATVECSKLHVRESPAFMPFTLHVSLLLFISWKFSKPDISSVLHFETLDDDSESHKWQLGVQSRAADNESRDRYGCVATLVALYSAPPALYCDAVRCRRSFSLNNSSLQVEFKVWAVYVRTWCLLASVCKFETYENAFIVV